MDTFAGYILAAFALMLVIEGLFYGLFTDAMRRMMQTALDLPPAALRNFGLLMASAGIFLLWLIEKF